MPCEAFTLLSNDVAAAMLVASLTSEYCDQPWEVGGNTHLVSRKGWPECEVCDTAAVTLRSEDNVTLSERVDGVETLTSSSDWRLDALPDIVSFLKYIWPLSEGKSSNCALSCSCKISLSVVRNWAAFSAVKRAACNVLWKSEDIPDSSEVILSSVEDSRASESNGEPSVEGLLGSSVWGTELCGAWTWNDLPSVSTAPWNERRQLKASPNVLFLQLQVRLPSRVGQG